MNLLQIGILIFCFIESLNVFILYINPTFKYGNGVGVFNDYHDLSTSPETSDFTNYLVNWVAGTKLIFILVGIVVAIFGNYNVQFYTVIALIVSILSFYYRLYPIIRRLDANGKLTPKGYSKTLNIMIISFLLMFVVIILIELMH